MENTRQTAYLALVLSVISLGLSGSMILTSTDTDEIVAEKVDEAQAMSRQEIMRANRQLSRELALTRARLQLAAVAARLEAREAYGDSLQEVQGIRRDLGRAYRRQTRSQCSNTGRLMQDLKPLRTSLGLKALNP